MGMKVFGNLRFRNDAVVRKFTAGIQPAGSHGNARERRR